MRWKTTGTVMGVEFSEDMLDFPALFSREAPVTLEIGFGMGGVAGGNG